MGELLFPLLGGKCLISGDHKHALKKKDVRLLLPHEFGWKGLGMGFKDAYYGEPDLMVIPEGQEDAHIVLNTAFEEEEKKKIRFRPDVRELSECIATAITFATIQSRRNSKIHGSPTIRIDPAGFDIVVYNPEFDVLLMSHLGWTRKAL